MENWKKFNETEERIFLVSSEGNLKNVEKATGKERIIKATVNPQGRRFFISPEGKFLYVYRLVAKAFIPNPENKPTVNHIRGLDAGDGVDNLEWMTHAEQDEHARRTGLKTSGNTPAITLDSNGIIIAHYNNIGEALSNYDGRNIYYNKDTKIIGNVIIMKKSYYDELSQDERFNIYFECFQRMLEFAYVVDGQLIDTVSQTAEILCYNAGNLTRRAKSNWSVNIKNHTVSRISVILNGSVDKNVETDTLTANAIKTFRNI